MRSGGLELQSSSTLAPSAFLASAGGPLDLMQQLLPDHISSALHPDRDLAQHTGSMRCLKTHPTTGQKSGDQPVVQHMFNTLLDLCTNGISTPQLLGAGSPESGIWLNTPPISSLGLHLPNDTIRIAIGLMPHLVAPTTAVYNKVA